MSIKPSYKCSRCGHEFKAADEGQLRCPRCGSDKVESRFLFGTDKADELTAQDYFGACLAP